MTSLSKTVYPAYQGQIITPIRAFLEYARKKEVKNPTSAFTSAVRQRWEPDKNYEDGGLPNEQCLNKRGGAANSNEGIDPNYKRTGSIIYRRQFTGAPSSEFVEAGAGANLENFTLDLIGIWPKSMAFPEFSMSDGDEGDSDSMLTMVICYDDIRPKY